MTYKYVNPCEVGFKKLKVTRREHNKLFPNRFKKFGTKVEYYWNEDTKIFDAQYFCHWWMKSFLVVALFVPGVIMQGIPEYIRDIGDLIHERERGKFSHDRLFLYNEEESDVLTYIRKQTGGLQ